MNVYKQLFPDSLKSIEELESTFPERTLAEGAQITRVGPSPTGFMHIGTLYVGLISERVAHQSGGLFYLRIEDTDKKREVEGATSFILSSFKKFGIDFDEGQRPDGTEVGEYGPYTQSDRMKIYHSVIKWLLKESLAYPCFCTAEELDDIRSEQERKKLPTGYYGDWALWRDRSAEEVQEMIESGASYVVRFKSNGDNTKKIRIFDKVLGERELLENNQDIVIMKSDGLPTYHLAHVVDDHFMRTTMVVRGGEWLPSLPTHLQLFSALGWKPPKYAHIMPINKLDGTSRRKLSKRKDPESNIGYFEEHGYPSAAVIDYLMNLANSSFEMWRKANPNADLNSFQLTFKGLQQSSGPLFDFDKLHDISKNRISIMSAQEVYDELLDWASKYDIAFQAAISQMPEYVVSILSIERGGEKARKDNATFEQIRNDIAYFFDDEFTIEKSDVLERITPINATDAAAIVHDYLESYDHTHAKDQWFETVKSIAQKHGFATNTKQFNENPKSFIGNVSDMVKIFRLLLTGRENTPDLHAIMQVLGEDRVRRRLAFLSQD